jgi:hypothetical protein
MTRAAIEGGCCCGALRYRLNQPPFASMVCHCRTCRRVAAAPVVGWVTVARDAFEVTQGEPAVFHSSPSVTRRFCRDCGTHLTYETADDTSYIDVSTCSLGDPDAFPPTHHSWLSHDLAWVKFGDGLPTYPRSRSD